EAEELRARAALATGNYADALVHAKAVTVPNGSRLVIFAELGLGHRDRAAKLFAALPSHDSLLDAMVLVELGRWSEAGTLAASIPEVLANRRELRLVRGRVALETGDPTTAGLLLQVAHRALLPRHPFEPVAAFALARALWDSGGDKARA